MKTIVKTAMAFFVSLAASAAFARGNAVEACTQDSYVQGRIEEHVPVNERLAVFNSKNQVVGAFHFDPEGGEIHALYLCGANSGYYYAEGNGFDGSVVSLNNDEYDSDFDMDEEDGKAVLNIFAIYFTGDPEYADYEPFSAKLYFNIPKR
ncbi:hypothetical protein AZI86_04185 [Bdellovibrio bacteriovorus]|uniref:Secreted protein n=1 Tax=Bdellovibrio bacteriovorus TaxID=959 RepID=A0A150WPZ4_BDEBC|nr:hypothetical protein [Bdellovibrio bacteriovorus]KYG66265.1 hypothetical protein AZI86_04185 [Bdellovibrio bacteriovorus]